MSDRIAEIEAALAYELKFNASACAVSFHVDHIRYLIERVRELERHLSHHYQRCRDCNCICDDREMLGEIPQ